MVLFFSLMDQNPMKIKCIEVIFLCSIFKTTCRFTFLNWSEKEEDMWFGWFILELIDLKLLKVLEPGDSLFSLLLKMFNNEGRKLHYLVASHQQYLASLKTHSVF